MADERDAQVEGTARRPQVPEHELRLAEVLENNRARVRSGEARLERNVALIRRVRGAAQRRQAAIERRAAAAARERSSLPSEPAPAPASGEDLYRRINESLLWAASIEDGIAAQHEVMAARSPDRADEYLQVAEQAREEAKKARARALRLSRSHDGGATHSIEPE